MNIKRYLSIMTFVLVFAPFLSAQETDVTAPASIESPIRIYTAAKDNWKVIPFVISNARNAVASDPRVESLAGAEAVKFDSQMIIKVIPKQIITNAPGAVRTQDGQNFEYRFIPREIGNYSVTLIGKDLTRPNNVDGIGERTVNLKVVYPFFKDPAVAPSLEIYEGEPLFFNFFIHGLENASDYKIVRTWKEVTDTIPGSILDMSPESGKPIIKGDAGQILRLAVLYQDKPFYYMEGDTAIADLPLEEKLTLMNAPAKISIFEIPILKQVPRVIIPRNDVPYGERIEFSAAYYGVGKSDPVQLNEIERPRVINLKNNQNIYQKHEQISPGKFAIWVKSGLTVGKDGLPIEIKVKVRGLGKEFTQRVKLVKKSKK